MRRRLRDPLEQELLDASHIRQVTVDDLRTGSNAPFAQLDRLQCDTDKLFIHIDRLTVQPSRAGRRFSP